MWLVTCRSCDARHAMRIPRGPACTTCGSTAITAEELDAEAEREIWRLSVGRAVRASDLRGRALGERPTGSGRPVPPPTPAELRGAPILEDWAVVRAPWGEIVLVGRVTGHPELPGDGRAIHTSKLLGLDREGRWARTRSRYYRLGAPVEGS